MKTKIKLTPDGASVQMEKLQPSGMYSVIARKASGELHDKITCDTYREACHFFKSFYKVLKNA